jgi:hypothetical protein
MSAMPIPFYTAGMQHKNMVIFPDSAFYAAPNQGAFMLSLLSYSLALSCTFLHFHTLQIKPAGAGSLKNKNQMRYCVLQGQVV